MAGIRCALTYQAAQHCRNQQAEVLIHAGNTVVARAHGRRRRRWGGRSRGLHRRDGERVYRSVGEESQPKHVNILSEKVIDLCEGSSTRLSSGTTVTII